MKELLWKEHIGFGVIDCAISTAEKVIIAGDVSGKVIILDYLGKRQSEYSYDIPVWGVDINQKADLFAVGLASKNPAQGGFVIVKSGISILYETTQTAVWDVKIIDLAGRVFASTWGQGLYEYDLISSSLTIHQTFLGKDIFGISEGKDNELYLTVAREGIYSFDAMQELKLLSQNRNACYNNQFSLGRVFYGSSTNIISLFDAKYGSDKHFKTLLNSPCGIGILGKYILIGDLEGKLIVSNNEFPHIPLFMDQFNGSIWNISIDDLRSLVFIACGDGFLYCYQFDSNSLDMGKFILDVDTDIQKDVLNGAKVFISYAREDEALVKVLYQNLKSAGCDPWVDFINLLPGQDWKYEIRLAIKNSDFVVVCLSNIAVSKKGYVQKELREALEIMDQVPVGEIFLIPIRLDDCVIPESLSNRHVVNLFSEDGLYKLLMAIYYQRIKSRL